jgi:hypothetical protein
LRGRQGRSGAARWLEEHDADELTAVAISPDLGERYLDTVYRPDWVRENYGEEALEIAELAAAGAS